MGADVNPATVSYSLIGDLAFAGPNGNLTGDPLFVNAASNDIHLLLTSLAIVRVIH